MNDVSHLFPQPHPTTFNPTLSHNMYCHLTRNTQQHHYHTTPGKWCYNTSTIRAKCLAEHCAGPENDSQRGGGGGGGNYYHNGVGQGAAPRDVCWGGGAKLPQCLATAARAITLCATLAQRGCVCVCVGGGGGGGDSDTFFPTSKICPKIFIMG